MKQRPSSSRPDLPLPQIDEGNFYPKIERAIAEKRHVGYLRGVLKDYHRYRDVLAGVFDQSPQLDQVFTFRVTYRGRPKRWREIELTGWQSLESFAKAIVYSMGWDYDHLHAFTFPDPDRKLKELVYGISRVTINAPEVEDDPHPTYKSDKVLIGHIDYRRFPRIGFIFDFGDGHEFVIEYTAARKALKKELHHDGYDLFPRLIDQRGVAPAQYPDYDRGETGNEGEFLGEE